MPGPPDTIATATNEDLTVVGYSGNETRAELDAPDQATPGCDSVGA
jgi:hypothetical protein